MDMHWSDVRRRSNIAAPSNGCDRTRLAPRVPCVKMGTVRNWVACRAERFGSVHRAAAQANRRTSIGKNAAKFISDGELSRDRTIELSPTKYVSGREVPQLFLCSSVYGAKLPASGSFGNERTSNYLGARYTFGMKAMATCSRAATEIDLRWRLIPAWLRT